MFRQVVIITMFSVSVAVVSAEVIFKDNFIGARPHSADAVWSNGVAAKPVDIDSIGIPESINPAIKAGDVAGTGANGAVQFTYKGEINSWSELRWTIADSPLEGRKGVQELWLQYDLFIPENFHERDVDGHWGSKHIALFGDTYSSPGHTVIIGRCARDKDVTTGNAWLSSQWAWNDADDSRHYFQLDNHANTFDSRPVIQKSSDAGTWQRLTVHASMPTSATSNNGILEFWVQCHDGSVVKFYDVHNGPWFNKENYLRKGYLLGWSNPGFAEQTKLYIDNVIVAESSAHIDLAAIGKSASIVKPIFGRRASEAGRGMMVDVLGRRIASDKREVINAKCKVGGVQGVTLMVLGQGR